MQIISVQFKSKINNGYSGREYSYYLKDGINLKSGDIVKVPTANGSGLAKVVRTGISEAEIEKIKSYMKTLESGTLSDDEIENETPKKQSLFNKG